MAQRAGVVCDQVAVGDPRSRWGSCSAGRRIRYSWRVIMAPDHVRTGLVAHEVAHLVHMHHGPAFHALVDDLIGDVARHSGAWLKEHGPALHRWRFDAS
jgi:predicted metal-dependent hydrolase